jgi:hypothetical protein
MVRIRSTQRMIVVGLVMVAAALGLSSMSVGAEPARQAPYPPPCPCALVLLSGEATATIGDCISITCRVTDGAGSPAAGVECKMSVLSQPGTGATLTPASATSDEKGETSAQLCVGRAAGSIVVLGQTECCQGQLEVMAQLPPPLAQSPQPPVVPPATGAGTGGGDSWSASLIAICGAIALAAGSVLVWQIGSRRRRSS